MEKVKNRIATFNTNKVTVLNMDLLQVGILMAILQNHCLGVDIRCCPEGWKLVLCRSRFCLGAESRYSPVEGEALAVAWGMWKSKYFLLRAKDLYVVVDHKPLLGLYRLDRQLLEVENPRLLNLV